MLLRPLITKEQITQLIEPEIVGTDIFLVDVKVNEGNRIHVIADADGGLSIYDHFSLPELEDKFVRVMKRAVKKDSMYSYSRSIVNKKDENPMDRITRILYGGNNK